MACTALFRTLEPASGLLSITVACASASPLRMSAEVFGRDQVLYRQLKHSGQLLKDIKADMLTPPPSIEIRFIHAPYLNVRRSVGVGSAVTAAVVRCGSTFRPAALRRCPAMIGGR